MTSFSSVTLGVTSLDKALEFWVNHFGLEMIDFKQGPDSELGRLWGIGASDVCRQALVRTAGHHHGMIHLVEFKDPDPPVRSGASTFDSCPKNLDIYVSDMPKQMATLRSLGHEFRNDEYNEITAPDGTRVREIHLPIHDDINVVLLQLLDETADFSRRGYCGVGPLVVVVPNAEEEKRFYQSELQLELLSENLLSGPTIEKMVGLPQGAALQYSILGDTNRPLGRIELIAYRGANGSDLFPRAKPKSRGLLHVTYQLPDLGPLISRLNAARISYKSCEKLTTLTASGDTISFNTPAGFRIEVAEGAHNEH